MFKVLELFRAKNFKVLSFVLIIIISLISMPMSNALAPRIDNPITKLGNGSSEKIITFPFGGGYNNDLNLTLPADVIVTEAQLELSGLGILGTSKQFTHTFQDTTNNNAWKGDAKNQPPTSAPSVYQTTLFTNTEYTDIKTSDNIKTTYITKVANDYPFHLFRFKITETNISYLNVYWEGLGMYNGPSIQPYWAYLYIYNVTSQKWELFGQNSSFFGNIDFIIQNNSLGSPSDYINTSYYLHLMAQGPQGFGGTNTADIRTDFVKVETLGTGVSFPTDPTLNIGNDSDVEWAHTGIFDQNITINDNYNFKTELQSLIDAASPGGPNVDVPLYFTSLIEGKIKISNISISYEYPEVNLPPFQAGEIPDDVYGFYEDTSGGDDLIDLNDYFWDDRDNASLIFGILINNEDVQAELDADGHHLDFSAEPNVFGTFEFQLRATDKGLDGVIGGGDDLYIDSDIFKVTVWPTNDAPVIDSIGGIEIEPGTTDVKFLANSGALEDKWFNKTVIGHDIDGDVLSFSANLTLTPPSSLEILPDPMIPNAVNISIFPTNDLVGELRLNITVSDENDTAAGDPSDPSIGPLTDSINLIIKIKNVNDIPKLNPIEDKIGYEDSWLNFTVSAMDDDLILGDELKFSTNITTSIHGLEVGGNFEFNEDTGNVSILPDNEMVGSYLVSLEVSDLAGKSDFQSINILINNVNDPPVAVISSPKSNQEWNTSKLIYFDAANSTDDDLIHGDSLSYVWSSNISGILSTEPQFASNLTDVGWHNITLTVSDESNIESLQYLSVQITPVIVDDKDDDKDNNGIPTDDDNLVEKKDKDPTGISSELLILFIIIIIIIIVLILILLRRKKAKDEEQEKADSEPEITASVVDYTQLPTAQPPTFHPLALTSPYSGVPFPPVQQFPIFQPSPQQYSAQPIQQPLTQPPTAEVIEQPMELVLEQSPAHPEAQVSPQTQEEGETPETPSQSQQSPSPTEDKTQDLESEKS